MRHRPLGERGAYRQRARVGPVMFVNREVVLAIALPALDDDLWRQVVAVRKLPGLLFE